MANDLPTVLVITELFPSADISYLGSFVVSQLDALKDRYRFVVIVPRFIRPSVPLVPFVRYGGVDVYSFRQFSWPLAVARRVGFCPIEEVARRKKKAAGKKISALAKRLHARYRFCLVHGHEAYVGDEAANVGRQLGIPSIVTIHHVHDYHVHLWGKPAVDAVVRNLNRATRLLTVSHMAADSYRNHGVKQPFHIIPNGINIPQFPPPLPEAWQRVARGKIVILAAGFFVPEKRFDQVISATIRLREKWNDYFVVLLIGTGILQPQYKRMIYDNRLENQVFIVGQVPPAEMPKYFSACDFFVHPSVVDSFSMVCLEAMGAGKPFICTDRIGITEYITPNHEAFIIPPDNLGVLVQRMDDLIRDQELRRRMGQAGLETAKKLQWEKIAPMITRIYDRYITAE